MRQFSMYKSRHILFAEEIEAVQIDEDSADFIAEWCNGLKVMEHDAIDHDKKTPGINVPTRSGNQRASDGWWVYLDSSGFHVMGPNAFPEAYEPVRPRE